MDGSFGNYVMYNDRQEIKDLDRNVWHATDATIADGATGRHLYKNEPRHAPYYTCWGNNDKEFNYILGVDRDDHPDHSSRFGYARCPNGYCSGHWPGRYISGDACAAFDPQPPNMAPERFYTSDHQGPFQDKSQASVDYSNWANYRD